jgi:hypothetical protein
MFIIIDKFIIYYMNFLDILTEYMDVNIYYKKLLKFDTKDIMNLYYYINIKWTKIINNIEYNKYSNKKLKKLVHNNKFNNNLNIFIDNDIGIALFVKNIIDRY